MRMYTSFQLKSFALLACAVGVAIGTYAGYKGAEHGYREQEVIVEHFCERGRHCSDCTDPN